jgi:hypothetical protein
MELKSDDINDYFSALNRVYETEGATYCANTFTLTTFKRRLAGNDSRELDRYISKLYPAAEKCTRWIVPININNAHWILAVVLPKINTVCIYDSMYEGTGRIADESVRAELVYLRYLIEMRYQLKNWVYHLCQFRTKQNDTFTCGVYVRWACEVNVINAYYSDTKTEGQILDEIALLNNDIQFTKEFQDQQIGAINFTLLTEDLKYQTYDYLYMIKDGQRSAKTLDYCIDIALHPVSLMFESAHNGYWHNDSFEQKSKYIKHLDIFVERDMIAPVMHRAKPLGLTVIASESIEYIALVLSAVMQQPKIQNIDIVSRDLCLSLIKQYDTVKQVGDTLYISTSDSLSLLDPPPNAVKAINDKLYYTLRDSGRSECCTIHLYDSLEDYQLMLEQVATKEMPITFILADRVDQEQTELVRKTLQEKGSPYAIFDTSIDETDRMYCFTCVYPRTLLLLPKASSDHGPSMWLLDNSLFSIHPSERVIVSSKQL